MERNHYPRAWAVCGCGNRVHVSSPALLLRVDAGRMLTQFVVRLLAVSRGFALSEYGVTCPACLISSTHPKPGAVVIWQAPEEDL